MEALLKCGRASLAQHPNHNPVPLSSRLRRAKGVAGAHFVTEAEAEEKPVPFFPSFIQVSELDSEDSEKR